MNKKDLEKEMRRLVGEAGELRCFAAIAQAMILENDRISLAKEMFEDIHKQLSIFLDCLATVERECQIRYNKDRRKREDEEELRRMSEPSRVQRKI
jgi:hypothetical protein